MNNYITQGTTITVQTAVFKKKQEVMIDRYWKLKIYKDGVCKSSFE